MRNVLGKSCKESENTFYVQLFFFSENRAVHEMMAKNMLGPNGPHLVWHTRFAFRITKATETHWEYVVLIDFPRQHCLCERAPVLRYSTLPLVLYILLSILTSATCFGF